MGKLAVFVQALTTQVDRLKADKGTSGHYVASLVMLWVLDILLFKYQKYIFFEFNSYTYYTWVFEK